MHSHEDLTALSTLRWLVTHGGFWRKTGWPEGESWLLDLYHIPHVRKPMSTSDWRPEHFLDILDDYERLLKKEKELESKSTPPQEDEVAACSLRRPNLSGYYPPPGC